MQALAPAVAHAVNCTPSSRARRRATPRARGPLRVLVEPGRIGNSMAIQEPAGTCETSLRLASALHRGSGRRIAGRGNAPTSPGNSAASSPTPRPRPHNQRVRSPVLKGHPPARSMHLRLHRAAIGARRSAHDNLYLVRVARYRGPLRALPGHEMGPPRPWKELGPPFEGRSKPLPWTRRVLARRRSCKALSRRREGLEQSWRPWKFLTRPTTAPVCHRRTRLDAPGGAWKTQEGGPGRRLMALEGLEGPSKASERSGSKASESLERPSKASDILGRRLGRYRPTKALVLIG